MRTMKQKTKTFLALFAGILLSGTIFSNGLIVHAAEELTIALQDGNSVEQLTMSVGETIDLRFLGAPDDWASHHPRWVSSNANTAEVDYAGVVKAKAPGIVCIHIFLDSGMSGNIFVYVEEKQDITVGEEPQEVSATEKKDHRKPSQVILKNQEAIHIPEGTTFADGRPLENIYDIVTYSFSFMLEDGAPVILTALEGNPTNVSELAGVDCSYIKGAKSIIVKSVYLKVFFDTDGNEWISASEKKDDAIGFYHAKVDVDKTLTVEDWSLVE